MNILMVANFVTFPWEGGNSRFTYILDKIDYEMNKVELITSKFRHETKSNRILPQKFQKLPYKITLLDEPGYCKNISLKRFFSHYKLSKELEKYLDKLEYNPDVIYCSVPSIDVAKIVTKYAKKQKIRLVIDIQDLWPEAFSMILNIPIVNKIIFYPIIKQANFIYSNADAIIAVSDAYVNRALSVNKKCNKGLSVFLGTDLKYFDECRENDFTKYNDDMIRIVYIGTLGTSYDIKSIIDAIKLLNIKGYNNIKFVIMGDGPLQKKFKRYAEEQKINFEFTGRLAYKEMVKKLCSCDIAVNPIISKSVASIINKVGDYAAAGLPVINTQNNYEYRELLKEYDAGINCENGNIQDISNKIELLILDDEKRKKLGGNNRKLAEEKFDREKTYNKIVDLIQGVK